MPHLTMRSAGCVAILLACATAGAEQRANISELSWTDKQYMASQIQKVDELVRGEFGGQLHESTSDLDLLQRIVNRGVVEKADVQTQQALGMALGNVIAKETGMKWYAYKDSSGRNRALCVAETEHCLFPVTMLSRRMSVGLYPDVNKLYSESMEMLAPHLAKSPYDAD
ncbi:DUF3806 domain-containing protein [Simiduia curdlanivorans]|uniref:DUF3806 domain-containing protein n=1 Tax=Simiduia curdlanivorans TaxID=1492769 RepID=A0ABV8V9W1_9GAMM|nr:DUF3806 domain-containing protein [Simiduia curdlanivorans]MDN3639687.1 DUF3806 domain-containing protein [Simiduia curdlanivorans]